MASHAPLSFEPPPDFSDPRLEPGFQPEDWPLCHDEPAPPPNPPGLHERRCLEFLAAFYRINVAQRRSTGLVGSGSQEGLPGSQTDEIAATKALEKLEDRYAPIGFFGEPVVKGLRCQNVIFVRPELPRLAPTASTMSAEFAIPGLEGIPASELTGPARVVRWGRKPVDSRKWIFENRLSPGDIVMLTAAVRDLHRACPGRFVTDVRTSCPALWEHNPHLTPLDPDDPSVSRLECHYPLIHQSNTAPYHFIHGFIQHLSEQLGVEIRPTEFKGDIHLSEEERQRPGPVEAVLGEPRPYWIVGAGGKFDYTIKWWGRRRWQEVVDHFRDRILFVQVGEKGHYHPPLKGVLDLRGKTSLRDLVRLVHYSDGIVCPVTLLMHLAAAVPRPAGVKRLRPCIVVAGGREPAHWEQYPGHQFIHTIGQLDCCAHGGCWKARTAPLGDGSPLDQPGSLCRDITPGGLPRCMDMISSEHVCQLIQNSIPSANS